MESEVHQVNAALTLSPICIDLNNLKKRFHIFELFKDHGKRINNVIICLPNAILALENLKGKAQVFLSFKLPFVSIWLITCQ